VERGLGEQSTRRPVTADRTRQRPRGPRSARKRAAAVSPSQPSVASAAVPAAVGAPAAPGRSSRGPSAVFKPLGLSREQEFAYIRSDMRRLFIVAGSLFALMVLILFIVER
jgi:hypothetical protein